MPRLKVLFIAAWYPTRENPIEGIFVREQAKAAKLYDDVAVLHCAGPGQGLKKLWHVSQETDETLSEGMPTYRVWYREPFIRKASYFIYLWSVFQGYRSVVKSGFQPDVIHAHYFGAGFFAVLLGKIDATPVIITEHFSAFPRRLLSRKDSLRARYAFKNAEMVVPVSYSLKESIENYGMKGRFQVIPNVVDTKIFSSSPPAGFERNGVKRLLCVGSLIPVKGIPHLLKALARLLKRKSNWHIDFIGEGSSRSEYEGMVKELGLSDKVTFQGLRSKQEISRFLQETDLFVLPSLCETFSAAAAEALATGTPVLATRCGGPEEFINDNVGVLVPPGDESALCEGIDRMLDQLDQYSHDYIERYAKEHFSPECVGEKLHDIYLTSMTRPSGYY